MEIRLFVTQIPKHCSKNDFVEAVRRQTKGSKRVLYSHKPEYSASYGLVWFDSLESALEALKKVIYIKSYRLEFLLFDDPRDQGGLQLVENRLGQSLYVDGVPIAKTDLSYSQGLQQAVSDFKAPKWCKYTLSEIDCPRGEMCNFIHLRRVQQTTHPNKRLMFWPIQQKEITANVYDNNQESIYEAQKIILSSVHSGSGFDTELAYDTDVSPSEQVMKDIVNTLQQQGKEIREVFVDLQSVDLVELILENKVLATELASKLDSAVEKETDFEDDSTFENRYTHVTNHCALNKRMNTSLSALLDFLRKASYESSVEENVRRFVCPLIKQNKLKESIILRAKFPEFEFEYFVTLSFKVAVEEVSWCADVIYPVHDFVFLKRAVYHHQDLHSSILSFVEEVAEIVVRTSQGNLIDASGRMTLRLGVSPNSRPVLVGIYNDGPQVDDQFFVKLREQPWKKIYRFFHKAPLVLVIDYPPVRAIQSSAPQSWLKLLRHHCEYR